MNAALNYWLILKSRYSVLAPLCFRFKWQYYTVYEMCDFWTKRVYLNRCAYMHAPNRFLRKVIKKIVDLDMLLVIKKSATQFQSNRAFVYESIGHLGNSNRSLEQCVIIHYSGIRSNGCRRWNFLKFQENGKKLGSLICPIVWKFGDSWSRPIFLVCLSEFWWNFGMSIVRAYSINSE